MAALQTKTFTSSYSKGYHIELKLTEDSVNTVQNTSQISYVLTLFAGGANFANYAVGHVISLNGKIVSEAYRGKNAPQYSVAKNGNVVIKSGSATVTHGSDGTLDMSVAFSISVYPTDYTPGDIAVSGKTMALTPIARASSIGATDAKIGAVSSVTIYKAESGYTNSVKYTFGALEGYLTEDGGVFEEEVKLSVLSLAWRIPIEFYAQIPNAKSGVCTLTCKTYSGNTQIGSEQTTTLTVTAAQEDCAPLVSGAVTDTNPDTVALTGSDERLVRFFSTAHCEISATAQHSATIAAKKVNAVPVDGNEIDFQNAETDLYVFIATDSRGYSGRITKQAQIVPYVKLTNNASIERTDPTSGKATLTVKGEFFNGSFGATQNTLTVKYKIGYGGTEVEVTPTITDGGYSVEAEVTGLTYTSSHTVTVTVSDKLMSVERKLTVKKGIPVFDWGEEDFNFNVPVTVLAQLVAESLKVNGTLSANELSVPSVTATGKISAGEMETGGKLTAAEIALSGKESLAVYVTEQYRSTANKVWNYRKYSDGSCELWMTVAFTGEAVSNAYGTLYRSIEMCAAPSSGADPYLYPFTVYAPAVAFSFNPSGNYTADLWVWTGGTTTRCPTFQLIRQSAASNISGTISIFVRGSLTAN